MKKWTLWDSWKMPVVSMIWLASMWILFYFLFNEIPMYYYGVFGVLVILFFSVTDRLAFFFYIALTLITVFITLFFAFENGWNPGEQVLGIGLHFVFLIHLFSLYSLSKYVYQFRKENQLLRLRVSQLEEYILEEGILTKYEFEKQASLILSTMNRRKETGFYIRLDLSKLNRIVRKKVLLKLASMSFSTLRKNYDLVGQLDDRTILLLLQNTDEKGLEITKLRLNQLLESKLEANVIEKIRWDTKKIEGHKTLDEVAVIK